MSKAIFMAAMGIFIHSGQGCVCGSRIFVQRGVYDQVVEGIAGVANGMKLGGPDEEGCMSGPLISAKQLTRVMGFIDEGKSEGVEVVTGGHRLDRKGYFVHPTVLTNVDPAMRLYQQEIFGPVVTILPFDDDEAVAMANDTTYGLAATAWTNNLSRAHRLGKRLQAGTVTINCQLVFDHAVALRWLQAVRLGSRVWTGGHRGLLEDEVGLGPALAVFGVQPARSSRVQIPHRQAFPPVTSGQYS